MAKGDDAVELELAGRTVRITSPDKVFFSAHGHTKLDLVEYYDEMADQVMATMGGRPTLMQRFPDGAEGKSFFQKRVPKGAPEWLETTLVATPNGTTSNAMVAADIAHVAWAVNMGCLGFHPWPYLAADPDHTDELRIDLDPGPGVGWSDIQQGAGLVHELLDELGIVGYPKTTGRRGLHIYVRLRPEWDGYQVRAAAVALARELERRHPTRLTAAWWKEERGERVFVDFNQNAPHKTVFGAWSVRAHPIAPVSFPITWAEVPTVEPQDFTIDTVPGLVAERGDAWAGIKDHPQDLGPLLEQAARDEAAGLPDAPWPPQYPKMPGERTRVAPSRAKKEDE
ncbi:MAG: non-homologous end-joining DNA ligase [Acidimicrobiia bacterium]|nr:non-homologous end-joining DNA ligase [Acidimicrobiia bacterium]